MAPMTEPLRRACERRTVTIKELGIKNKHSTLLCVMNKMAHLSTSCIDHEETTANRSDARDLHEREIP